MSDDAVNRRLASIQQMAEPGILGSFRTPDRIRTQGLDGLFQSVVPAKRRTRLLRVYVSLSCARSRWARGMILTRYAIGGFEFREEFLNGAA